MAGKRSKWFRPSLRSLYVLRVSYAGGRGPGRKPLRTFPFSTRGRVCLCGYTAANTFRREPDIILISYKGLASRRCRRFRLMAWECSSALELRRSAQSHRFRSMDKTAVQLLNCADRRKNLYGFPGYAEYARLEITYVSPKGHWGRERASKFGFIDSIHIS